MSFRLRLLLAAVAIVVVSLTLSGVLTWALVSRLEENTAQDQLARNVVLVRPQIVTGLCPTRINNRCVAPESPAEFNDDVDATVRNLHLGPDAVIVLDQRRVAGRAVGPLRVAYDSSGQLTPNDPVPLGKETTVAGTRVREATASFVGKPYFVAALPLATRYSTWLVLARPKAAVAATATSQLVPRILGAALAGLGLALLAVMLIARAFSKPLRELKAAAEDIAAGNYGRRVGAAGPDEIGVVGKSFNRMAEAVERSRATQRDFLANVSHELKTPLTSLIGFSQALMDGSLVTDEEKAHAAGIIHEESERVLRMSQELLDLARVESGQLRFDSQPVDMGAQLQQEIEIVRQRAGARGLRLRLEVPQSLPPVLADPERLHQILENLLDNAVKYAPEGSEIAIAAEPAAGGQVGILVGNEVGTNSPDPSRMFDRFYRADPSRSSVAGGVGLGLAISRQLAAAQGGSLSASVADHRLEMRLELPAERFRAAGASGAFGAGVTGLFGVRDAESGPLTQAQATFRSHSRAPRR